MKYLFVLLLGVMTLSLNAQESKQFPITADQEPFHSFEALTSLDCTALVKDSFGNLSAVPTLFMTYYQFEVDETGTIVSSISFDFYENFNGDFVESILRKIDPLTVEAVICSCLEEED